MGTNALEICFELERRRLFELTLGSRAHTPTRGLARAKDGESAKTKRLGDADERSRDRGAR